MATARPRFLGTIAACWGILGVLGLVGSAVVRLTPVALDALTGPLEPIHYIFVVGWVLFMAYGEGYRGFQRAFSPRVVARASWLRHNPTLLRALLAPAFCMGFFHATRKRLIVSWTLTTVIVLLIIGVKLLPPPWRGLVDAGVVVGLSWGMAAVVAWGLGRLSGRPLPAPPDRPAAA